MSDLDFLSIKEAALICEVSASTIQNFIDIGSLNLYDPKVIAAKFNDRRNYRIICGDQAYFEEDTLVCRAELESLFGSEIRRNFWNLSRKRGKKDNLRELLERSDRLKDEVLPRLKQKILDSVEVGSVRDINEEREFSQDLGYSGSHADEIQKVISYYSEELADEDLSDYVEENKPQQRWRGENLDSPIASELNTKSNLEERIADFSESSNDVNYDSEDQADSGEEGDTTCFDVEIKPQNHGFHADEKLHDLPIDDWANPIWSSRDLIVDAFDTESQFRLSEEHSEDGTISESFDGHLAQFYSEDQAKEFSGVDVNEIALSASKTMDALLRERAPARTFEDKISSLAIRSGHYVELSGVSKAQPLMRKFLRKQNDARALEPNFRKSDKKLESKKGKDESHSSIYSGMATRRDLNSPTREDLSKKIKEIRELDEKRKADSTGRSGSVGRKQGRVVAVSKSINGNQSLLTGDLTKKADNDTLAALSQSLSPDNLPMPQAHNEVEVPGIREKELENEIKSNEETIAWLKQRVQNLESKLDLAYAVCESHRRAVLFLRNYRPSIWHRIGMFLGILPKVLLVNKSNQLRDVEESQEVENLKYSVG